MAQITAALVKKLREMTDSPMMECKKALVEADGDIEKAVDVLRTMGIAKAVKRAGRDTNEGTIACYVTDCSKVGAILELTCETDFVGTNPKFTGFAARVAEVVAKENPASTEELLECPFENETVGSALTEMIHTIGENMKIARFERREAQHGGLSSYIHLGGKLGVLVEFSFNNEETATKPEFKTFAHDVAMQIAAINPLRARRDEVPAEIVERELEIYRAQAAESGKPEFVQEKMVQGRLEKFYKESVLTEQEFIKDSSVTISDLAKKVSKECNDTIEIMSFIRYAFGE